jgi:hypothetical protein
MKVLRGTARANCRRPRRRDRAWRTHRRRRSPHAGRHRIARRTNRARVRRKAGDDQRVDAGRVQPRIDTTAARHDIRQDRANVRKRRL